jgi:hypothetical protein
MEQRMKRAKRKRTGEAAVAPIISQIELARLGGGQVAYIKELKSDEARRIFPAVEGLPSGLDLFSLHAADGTPIALTDTRQAAVSHAMGDELEIASVH